MYIVNYEHVLISECNGGTWGEDCLNSCGNCYNGTACNKAHGECPVTKGNPRCSVGYVHTNKTCDLREYLISETSSPLYRFERAHFFLLCFKELARHIKLLLAFTHY